MTENEKLSHHLTLFGQLRWFLALRWVAAAGVVVGGVANLFWLNWFEEGHRLIGVGLFLIGYNAVLSIWWRRRIRRTTKAATVGTFISAQVIIDLALLSLLIAWTGGVHSPLIGFFVFHMAIASLLLPSGMAWVVGAFAVLSLALALSLAGLWPNSLDMYLHGAGWASTLLITIYLVNRITSDLRRQRKRLAWKNRRIRKMARQLEEHQNTVIQHEKSVTMGQMAAGIAHEIANPLANMDSIIQLIRRRQSAPRPSDIDRLSEQIRRMDLIIRQMSEFAHQNESQRVNRDINELVQQAMQMVRFDHRIRNTKVDLRLSDEAGEVLVTPGAFVQVMINLIQNSLDAMDGHDAPLLVISTEPHSDGMVAVRVADNGSGISPENLNLIFRPFFSTKPIGKGTGLGLSISRRLIERNDGRLDVESNLGKGTTFSIYLPESINS